ncbi:MAG: TlpA disulfide reductase family protein [Polyangiaceae bacterium]|jgi:peroxiredoxin
MRHGLPFLIALATATAIGCTPQPPSSPSRVMPDSLPATPLITLERTRTDLSTLLHGRTAVIHFWATWCDTCVGEFDALKRLDVQARARPDALIVGVAVGESPETVAAFVRERGVGFAQLIDEDFRLSDALGERSVPVTLVVDRSGRIVHRGRTLDAAALAAFRGALGAPGP